MANPEAILIQPGDPRLAPGLFLPAPTLCAERADGLYWPHAPLAIEPDSTPVVPETPPEPESPTPTATLPQEEVADTHIDTN